MALVFADRFSVLGKGRHCSAIFQPKTKHKVYITFTQQAKQRLAIFARGGLRHMLIPQKGQPFKPRGDPQAEWRLLKTSSAKKFFSQKIRTLKSLLVVQNFKIAFNSVRAIVSTL